MLLVDVLESASLNHYCTRPTRLGHTAGRTASMILDLREYTGAWKQVG
jgi:hypothetical protein